MNIDKVKKDFYTYIHKYKETGVPFYVGKGRGNRAYSNSKRSNAWKRKIDSLANGYEVEIVESGISETEAYELESELIKKHGFEWDNTGTLVNQGSGEHILFGGGVSFPINLSTEIEEALEKEDDFRNFTYSILPKAKEFHDIYNKIQGDSNEDSCTDIEDAVSDFCYFIPKIINKFNSSKISFREFVSHLEFYVEGVEFALEDADHEVEKEGMLELAKTIYDFFSPKLNYLDIENESKDAEEQTT
jgi:hypothetical protein